MIGLIIGASEESIYAIKVAQELGFYVIAFDQNDKAKGLLTANESHVLDIRRPEEIIKALDGKVPDVVLPVPIGRVLVTTGAINDYYRLTGISEKACDLCTDKYQFDQSLFNAGLRNTLCTLVKKDEILKGPFRWYPIIAKPRFGSGSRSVFVINDDTELEKCLLPQIPFDEDFIVEALKPGTEYGIDGAIINGNFHLILLREKIMTDFPIRQCIGYYSVPYKPQNQTLFKKIAKTLSQASQTLQLNHCLIHADILYHNEEVFIIEMSPRPSGHNLHNLFTPLATGVNMIKEYISYAVPTLGLAHSFNPTNIETMLIRYFDFENCIVVEKPTENYLKSKYPIVAYQCNIGIQYLGPVVDGHSIMGRGYFILKGKNKEELEKTSQLILEEFKLKKRDCEHE